MPIITKPSTIDKNSPAEISLDKAALAAVSSVMADDYFSDSDNWKEVFIYYKSSTGNQREILKFNATVSSPTADFLVSDKALDIFEVQKIVIVDFDAGSITIPRSQLTTSEFDVDMSVVSPSNAIVWVNPFTNAYNIESDGGLTNGSARGGDRFVGVFSSTQILTGDFELIFNIGNFGLDTAFGFTDDPSGLGPSPFHGTVASAYGENNLHINNAYVTYPSLANSQFKITRIGSTTSFYKDNVLITSTTAITGTKYLYASLPYLVGSGSLISSSVTVAALTYDYINWDLTNGPTTNAVGAVLTNPSSQNWFYMMKSSTGYSGDFEINYSFEGVDCLEIGVGMADNTTLGVFTGSVAMINRSGTYFEINTNGDTWLPGQYSFNAIGTNTIKFSRIGSTVTVYLNGVSVHSYSSSATLYPLGRPYLGNITSSYYAEPSLNGLYFETISTGVTRSGNSINLPSSQSMSYGLDEDSLGSGAALLDVTFNLSNMSSGKNIRIGLTEGVDGITQDSGPATYTRFYFTITDSNIVRFDVGGNQQVILSSSIGSSLTFRIEQTSTQYRYYYNSALIFTESIQYTLNAYKPFIRSNSTDVTCLATGLSGDAIIWEPISNSYNAEADGGLTNGAGRGGSAYYNVYSNTQTVTAGGDIDITYNVGSFAHDTALGFISTEESTSSSATPTFCGIVSGFGDARPHINSVWVSSAGIDPSNKTFRITRISGVITMYIDSVQIYTTSVATAPNIKPIASLAASGGSLISSSII